MKPNKLAVIVVVGVATVFAAVVAVKNHTEDAEPARSMAHEAAPVTPVVPSKNDQNSRRLYDVALKEIEARNPELNPDLPGVRNDLIQAIGQRMDSYVSNGSSRQDALRRAVGEVKAEELVRERQARDDKEQLLQSGYADEESQRQKRQREQARREQVARDNFRSVQVNAPAATSIPIPIPVPEQPQPSVITNCDPSGCWDNLGGRYNKAAGSNYFRSDGKFCQSMGGQMMCN